MRAPVGRRSVLALALGVVAGLLSGLFGVGGGIVLVPGLTLVLALAQHRAHATSLAAIILVAASALPPFVRLRAVAFGPAAALAAGALVGAWLGAGLMDRIPGRRLRQGFALLLLVVAARLVAGVDAPAGGAGPPPDLVRWGALAGFGLATGVLSAVLGVGGGVILVPGMVLLFGFSQHTAEGTSLLVIVPTAVTGALRHARSGYTQWRLAALLGIAGAAGGQLGSRFALALEAAALQRLFGVFLLAVALRLLAESEGKEAVDAA
ncbi:MAG TPA: sulfite exporter TauE/SafE family protein [Egibacteraceae bacterium]|nr:sulfite exporter TauE/SafE family protein [Egibacteraceae bacterium]